jgi:threonine synthase
MPAGEPYPFRCPQARAGDDIDHVLSRVLSAAPASSFPTDGDPQPFVRYRRLLHAWHLARERQLGDDEYVALIHELDERLSRVAGRGLRVTPFQEQPALAECLGLDVAALYVKDETGNVTGSHKARHLFGLWVQLEVADRSSPVRAAPAPLAIASCGNAALAAAVMARAAGRPLRAYLPSWAAPDVLARLEAHGAELNICPRQPGVAGDPAYLAFQAGLAGGEIPFCCQGPDNGLALDGGRTLAYEMVGTLATEGRRLDRLFVQVGGGALASSCLRAFDEARALGALHGPPPRFHAVQTDGNAPLARAYDRVAARILRRAFEGVRLPTDRESTARLMTTVDPEIVEGELRRAARERSTFMWPWEQQSPSLATGILDDEAYDWWAVVRGMIESGGFPVVVDEETLREAHATARRCAPAKVSATGAAGLAGALQLARTTESLMTDETIAVIFTGGSEE